MYRCLGLNDIWSGFGFAQKSAETALPYLVEDQATVVSAIEPGEKGRIRLHGIFWFACADSASYGTIPEGASVIEVGRVGNTLIVRPAAVTSCLGPDCASL